MYFQSFNSSLQEIKLESKVLYLLLAKKVLSMK